MSDITDLIRKARQRNRDGLWARAMHNQFRWPYYAEMAVTAFEDARWWLTSARTWKEIHS